MDRIINFSILGFTALVTFCTFLFFGFYFDGMSLRSLQSFISLYISTSNSLLTPIIIGVGTVSVALVPIIFDYKLEKNKIFLIRRLFDILKVWVFLVLGLIFSNILNFIKDTASVNVISITLTSSVTWTITSILLIIIFMYKLLILIFDKYKKNYVQKDWKI